MVNGHGDSNFSVIRPAILDMTNLERYAIFQFNNGYVSDLGGAACLLVAHRVNADSDLECPLSEDMRRVSMGSTKCQ
jgi:hypothetical protein